MVYNVTVMNVGIYCNKKYLPDNLKYVRYIKERLSEYGISCSAVCSAVELDGIDVLMVLGGDGTILTVAADCARRGIKIMGINYGHMGFLADFEPEQFEYALRLVSEGKYQTERRSMIEISFSDKVYYALNDLVIQRCTSGNGFSNTVNLRAEIDGSTVDNYSSDGLIVSTPTGSTAYSLAAGGSILTPDLEALIMTPICAHSLHSRPIVFSDKSVLRIFRIDGKSALNIIVDGKVVQTVHDFDFVTVRKSLRFVEFITSTKNNFFDKLLIKLNIWSK